MKTKTNKPNPRRILGCLMAFAMVFFTTSHAIAQNAVTITVGGSSFASEVSWDLTDDTGAIIASGVEGMYPATLTLGSCYDMNMYDSWGDGWNGGTYTITDDLDGTVYASGGLTSGSFGTDNFCANAPPACSDNLIIITCGGGSYQSEVGWTLYNSAGAIVLSGGAPYSSTECLPDDCYTLMMTDSWGDGWNGNQFVMGNFGYAAECIYYIHTALGPFSPWTFQSRTFQSRTFQSLDLSVPDVSVPGRFSPWTFQSRTFQSLDFSVPDLSVPIFFQSQFF